MTSQPQSGCKLLPPTKSAPESDAKPVHVTSVPAPMQFFVEGQYLMLEKMAKVSDGGAAITVPGNPKR
jgi:hypothetical protein